MASKTWYEIYISIIYAFVFDISCQNKVTRMLLSYIGWFKVFTKKPQSFCAFNFCCYNIFSKLMLNKNIKRLARNWQSFVGKINDLKINVKIYRQNIQCNYIYDNVIGNLSILLPFCHLIRQLLPVYFYQIIFDVWT